MRMCTGFLAVAGLAAATAVAQASGQRDQLRISLTVLERCDIHHGPSSPRVDCTAGVPWTVAPPTSARAAGPRSDLRLPVPEPSLSDDGPVTTIVF